MNRTISRRRCLSIGSAAFGLTLPRLLAAESRATQQRMGKARSVVVLYLSGGPSQLDMWDMKPNASEEVRGTFKPVSTSVPGIRISEHMPKMAKLAHKYTIVRSMSHDESDHLRAGHFVMTGGRLTRPITAFSGMERTDFPHLGSVVSRELTSPGMPSFVMVPEFVSPRGIPRPGQHAGFLGPRFDPYAIESDPNLSDYNPGPIAGESRTPIDQLQARRDLLFKIENASRHQNRWPQSELGAFRETALDLVCSPGAKRAFDISLEPSATRDRYGRHIFGQSALVARRMVEAGVRLVQVNFIRHDNGKGGQGYDSHSSPPNPPHLQWAKDELLPPTDAAFAALVQDLDDRGLLEETLVVMMGEFGRTPTFNKQGGRDHWPGCYSLVMAGGGVTDGAVFGESDSTASRPVTEPISPLDILATIYHQLGIDHQQPIFDIDDRPHVIADGKPVYGLLT